MPPAMKYAMTEDTYLLNAKPVEQYTYTSGALVFFFNVLMALVTVAVVITAKILTFWLERSFIDELNPYCI